MIFMIFCVRAGFKTSHRTLHFVWSSLLSLFFFFKQKTAYEIASCLVGSEMCIRDRYYYKGIELRCDKV